MFLQLLCIWLHIALVQAEGHCSVKNHIVRRTTSLQNSKSQATETSTLLYSQYISLCSPKTCEVTYCPILYNPQTPPTSPRKTCRKFCKHPCTLKYPQERSGVRWPRRKPHCSSRIWGWSQRWTLLSSSLHFPRKPSVISLNLKYTSKSQFKDRGTPTPVWRAQSATSMQCCRCMSTQEHPEL